MKRLTPQQRARLADPDTHAAMDAAREAAEALFGPQLQDVMADLLPLMQVRDERPLTATESVNMIGLWARFHALAEEQKRFASADLTRRLQADDGGT